MKNPRAAVMTIGICAVLLSPSLAPGLGARQEQTVQPELRRAIELIEEGDFAAAADLLEAMTSPAAAAGEGLSPEAREMVLAYLYYGIARLYLASEDDARRAFQDAQRLDPAYEPEASAMPRRVMEIWEEVRNLGALVVVTTPEGAAVYLDGEMQGSAPVDVAMLAPGEYRVTVTRDGYLDDTRVVTVVSGRDATVRVEMNPAAAEPAPVEEAPAGGGAPGGAAQAEAPPRGGGGLGTGALVGLLGGVGAAVGVGVAVAGGGSSAAPPPPLPPPVPTASVPAAPSAPTLTAGDRQLGVSWTAPASNGAAITDYDVRYRQTGVVSWTELNGQFLDRSATITGLTNRTSYEVQVRAANSVGEGLWSASATGMPVAGEYEITLTDVRFDRVEEFDSDFWRYWVKATARNTGSRSFAAAVVVSFYDRNGTNIGSTSQGIVAGTWSPGEEQTGVGYQYIPTNNRSNVAYYRLRVSPDDPDAVINCIGCDQEYRDVPITQDGDSRDRAVLMELYNATDGANWVDNTNWGSDAPLDQWYGVEADENGRVTFLVLEENRLTGPVPSSLGNLTSLVRLSFWNNELSGPIPPSLGSLTNLELLHLGANELSGPIPPSLGSLTNLVDLRLPDNELSGPIPPSLGGLMNLEYLNLNVNELSGPIPPSLGSLTNLEGLWLLGNRLTRSIPAALCQFEDSINPQQGGVNLPCEPSAAALAVSDAWAEEAAGAAVAFAVTLSRAGSDPVTVDYATRDGSARAGEDYAAASGTLTFATGESRKTVEVAVLDDAHDEGGETFVLALSNASGARLEDAEATGTIENADLVPAALLARFGRASAEHVADHVEERMAKPREPGFRARFAGRDVGPGMERDFALDLLSQLGRPAGMGPTGVSPVGRHGPGAGIGPPDMAGRDVAMGGAAFPPGYGASGGGDFAGSVLPGGDLLSGSEFELNRERHGGVLSVWSRTARSSFGGRQGALSLNGDVRTTMLGADYTRGRLVAGLSLARSRGLGGYDGRHPGQVESSATGLYPWLGYRLNDRVSVWGVTGYGTGAMRLTPDGTAALESGLSMAMAAAGTRGELVGSRAGGGFALAFKADALWVGTSVDRVDSAAGRLSASDAAVTRIRTSIEGSRGFAIGGRIALTPSVELGVRQDGGDAETGTGVDVGGGLSFTDSSTGLSLELHVRTLVAHQAEGFTDRGISLSFGWNPTPSSPQGFAARVAPSWGGDAQGSEALWSGGPLSQLGTYGGQAAAGRVDAELGYGLPVGRRFVGTPRVGFGSSAYGRTYRLGYRLGALGVEDLDFELGVDTQRRESPMLHGGDLGVLGRASVRW